MLMGGVYARYADSVSGTAGVAALRLSGATHKTAGSFTGSLSRFSSGEWVTQVAGFGAAVAPVGNGISLGVSAAGDANRIQGGSWNGQASGGLLGVLSVNRTLVTVGASIGTARTVYDSTLTSAVVSGHMSQTVGQGVVLSGGIVALRSDSIRYADVTAGLNYTGGKIRASISGGVRAGDLEDDPWGQGHLEYDVLSHVTYELTLGRYPQSLVGFTDGLYLTTGLRFRLTDRPPASRAPEPPVGIEVFETGRVRVVLEYADEAETIEIAGAWNGWLPLAMQKEANNRWAAELFLEPGIYKYAIVVNGDTWTVPDGVPSEPDDFGGEVATLVVTGGGVVQR